MNLIRSYIENLNQKFRLGNTTEHSFRGDLATLIQGLFPKILVTNEPKRQTCGAPDYILTKNELPIGFIEAKDLENNDLEGKDKNKEQFDRYKKSLHNLIFTDYVSFHFYKNGELTEKTTIGIVKNGKILPLEDNFDKFYQLLADFCSFDVENIKTAQQLTEIMARKSRFLAEIIENALLQDKENTQNSSLYDQFSAFKEILIHDISEKDFADVYAQTIAYGLFTARYHDPTLPTFSRSEAYQLLPKSNPFLKKLFGYLAGLEVDTRIEWIVDDLISVFLACDVATMLQTYQAKHKDPIVHFYEDYLQAYDPKKRKALGVWYTPTPVVDFMVRALDEVLKTHFSIAKGLADTSKVKVKNSVKTKLASGGVEENQVEKEFHRVQILDPATGTGTFLAQIVEHIYGQMQHQQGLWQSYVQEHLLPRLSGFELLMASYAIAHLKLDLLLQKTGFRPQNETQRLQVFLTNSLEEPKDDFYAYMAKWLSDEANEANHIKRDTPVMCIIGNPPYAISSNNKNAWIESLVADYKKGLKEKSFNSLSDDYVKFIRYGEQFIEKNGSGVLAYISNNSFLDGIVFRQMRQKLLKTFDQIYIIDLHGNSKKEETAPDGSPDQNVFDIMQGVSINIFIKASPQPPPKEGESEQKKNTQNAHAQSSLSFGEGGGRGLYHFDLYGKRAEKFAFLQENSLTTIPWTKITFAQNEENFFFKPKDFSLQKEYDQGFSVTEIFKKYISGVQTGRDSLFIDRDKNVLARRIKKLLSKEYDSNFINEYNIKDSSGYNLLDRIENTKFSENNIRKISYRPFQNLYIYYDEKLVKRSFYSVMKHFIKGENIGLCLMRSLVNTNELKSVFVTKNIMDINFYGFQTYVFPLYLYSDEENGFASEQSYNFNVAIVKNVATSVGAKHFSPQQTTQLFYYIYAVLHSPAYRERYKEFLKIDFPKIPYPSNGEAFTQLASLGETLVKLHLLEDEATQTHSMVSYPIAGTNTVDKIVFAQGNVYINDTQYFNNVPLVAWEFFVGGYQPAQKWLKDRKGQTLGFDDIIHYQKMINALAQTSEIMQEIDTAMSFPK